MIGEWTTAANVITGFATLAMLVVWAFYAKIAFNQYRESRRPWFIIESGGPERSATCYLVNMSDKTAHVSALLAVVHSSRRRMAKRIRKADASAQVGEGSLHESRIGPVEPGSTLPVGSFEDLFDDLIAGESGSDHGRLRYEDVECVEVRVVAESIVDHEGPVGASRRFLLRKNSDSAFVVRPSEMTTQQMRSREDRRRVRDWLTTVWEHEGFDSVGDPGLEACRRTTALPLTAFAAQTGVHHVT